MLLRLFLIVIIFLPTSTFAGSLVIAKYFGQEPVVPNIKIKADYVAIPIEIKANYKSAKDNITAVENTRNQLIQVISQQKGLQIKPGLTSLSPSEKSSYFSKVKSYSGSTEIKLYIFGDLSESYTVFSQTIRIIEVLSKIKIPEDVELQLSETTLGVKYPEKYRPELLKKISKFIAENKTSLGANGAVKINGLENNVSIVQLNDTEVSVFINYTLEISM